MGYMLREFSRIYQGQVHIQRFGATGSDVLGQEEHCQIHHYKECQSLISYTWIFVPASWHRLFSIVDML